MEFSEQINELVKEYNANSRANTMLYKDKEVEKLFKSMYGIDRFEFVHKCNSISKALIALITPYHDRAVIIIDRNNKPISGVIEHLPTRVYTGQNGEQKTTSNDVSFRTYSDGSEGIALWINTGDKYTTHLYNAENIQLKPRSLS